VHRQPQARAPGNEGAGVDAGELCASSRICAEKYTHSSTTSEPAAPKPDATPLRPMQAPMTVLPAVNNKAASKAPSQTSAIRTRWRGMTL